MEQCSRLVDPAPPIRVREMFPGEAGAVASLIARVFAEHIAPLYSPEGSVEFHRYASAEGLASRLIFNHLVLVAEAETGRLVGAAELRDFQNLSLLFVESNRQRRGVGRALLGVALDRCRRARPDLRQLTVNASPNSVPAYRQLGFVAQGQEQERDGIRFTPMALSLAEVARAPGGDP